MIESIDPIVGDVDTSAVVIKELIRMSSQYHETNKEYCLTIITIYTVKTLHN